MSKRCHENFSEAGAGGSVPPGPKRSRADNDDVMSPGDAIDVLLDNAGELLDCIKSLKYKRVRGTFDPQSIDPDTRKTLVELISKSVPSALQVVGEELRQPSRSIAVTPEQPAPGKRAHKSLPNMVSPTSITAWNLSDISDRTPPLPAVLDSELETAALTHSALAPKYAGGSYERLEWIGDAYLYLISSSLIYQTFTSLSPGRCAQLREILVRNSTLAGFSIRYSLGKRANIPPEFLKEGREGGSSASKSHRQKVLGDIFEAYVGAIIMSDPERGMARAATWLKSLWASTLAPQLREEEAKAAGSAELPPKTLLAKEIVVPGVKLRYEDIEYKKIKKNWFEEKRQHFSIGVFLDGWGETNKQLGWGTAISKNEAGQRAAKLVLKNNMLMKRYSTLKKEYLAAHGDDSPAKS